jgi:hypothetical protein
VVTVRITQPTEAGRAWALSTRELAAWVCGLFALARLADLVGPHGGGLGRSLEMTDAIGLTSWGCAAVLLWRDTAATAVRRGQLLITLALLAVAALAPGRVGYILLAASGLMLAFGPNWSSNERRVGAILFATGLQRVMAKILAVLFGDFILRLDTALAGMVMQLIVPGVQWSGHTIKPPDGVGIQIYMGCSSFANLSLVCLCYTSLSALDGGRLRGRNMLAASGVCAVIVALNTVRLLLMARSLPMFVYWHTGFGSQIFAVVMSVAAVVLCSVGSRWANART